MTHGGGWVEGGADPEGRVGKKGVESVRQQHPLLLAGAAGNGEAAPTAMQATATHCTKEKALPRGTPPLRR